MLCLLWCSESNIFTVFRHFVSNFDDHVFRVICEFYCLYNISNDS